MKSGLCTKHKLEHQGFSKLFGDLQAAPNNSPRNQSKHYVRARNCFSVLDDAIKLLTAQFSTQILEGIIWRHRDEYLSHPSSVLQLLWLLWPKPCPPPPHAFWKLLLQDPAPSLSWKIVCTSCPDHLSANVSARIKLGRRISDESWNSR